METKCLVNELKTLKEIAHGIATGKREIIQGGEIQRLNIFECREEAEILEKRLGKLIKELEG